MESTTTAPDGASITVESYGSGPGVVVVHGGALTTKLYRRFAQALSDRCTVHLFNRRGRPGGAALPPSGYTVQVDIDDIGAVLRHTGATRLFGHSVGGFVALRAAMILPVEKLGLFDAAIQRLGISAGDALFVGDNFALDVVGASDAGLAAMWYRRESGETPQGGHQTIADLAELPPLLDP